MSLQTITKQKRFFTAEWRKKLSDAQLALNKKKQFFPSRFCKVCEKGINRRSPGGSLINESQYEKSNFCSYKCRGIFQSENNIKEKNPSWKGGISTENELIRHSKTYKLWRESVYIRDNFTCQECGKMGGNLNAHHIKSFSKFPELRFAIDNGITLCKDCHILTSNYGRKKS